MRCLRDAMQPRFTQTSDGVCSTWGQQSRSRPAVSGEPHQCLQLDERVGWASLSPPRPQAPQAFRLGSATSPGGCAARRHAKRVGSSFWSLSPLYLACVAADGAVPEKKLSGTKNVTRGNARPICACGNDMPGVAKPLSTLMRVGLSPRSPDATPMPPKGSGSMDCALANAGPGPRCLPPGSGRSSPRRSSLTAPATRPSSTPGSSMNCVPCCTAITWSSWITRPSTKVLLPKRSSLAQEPGCSFCRRIRPT